MMKENIYTLFVGFRKLGEFKSILEAKKFAQSSNLAGVFNLLGENYRDSWYVFKAEIKDDEN
ncbi:conserved hypothetical protein [uncultured Dysgonomonas sp.]|uniref:SPOR domain-containing protein n=1 Tax=uncultured Dysgonomonas sp. TaxID=206096 RepID=A0A212K0W8_9BACT|nr:hypothetical protein [uncultured Dysgonomonas sp.]SBW05272.1 conserved hypothetical protein [uncultured Dysgonomonas sp.]